MCVHLSALSLFHSSLARLKDIGASIATRATCFAVKNHITLQVGETAQRWHKGCCKAYLLVFGPFCTSLGRMKHVCISNVRCCRRESDHSREESGGTTDIDPQYLHTVSIHGREYQRFSIEHSIYFSPVDDVRMTCLIAGFNADVK